MKNDKIQDERIIQERRKIQSNAYGWIVLILLASIIVQAFFMKAPFSQYAVELFIVVGCGFYITIIHLKKGIDIWTPTGESKKKILFNTVLTAIASTILLFILGGNYDAKSIATYFVTFIISIFTVRLIIMRLHDKKQQTIEKELDDDDL